MNKKDINKNIKNIITSILLLSVLVLVSMYFDGKNIIKEGDLSNTEQDVQVTYKEITPEVFNSMINKEIEDNDKLLFDLQLKASEHSSENVDDDKES